MEGHPKPRELPVSPFDRWRPPELTAPFRPRGGLAPLARWEAVLRAERSTAFRLAMLCSTIPVLARLLRIPLGLASAGSGRLEDREERVALVRRSRLPRLPSRRRKDGSPGPVATTADGRPKPGPLTDREIDAAMQLVGDMPFEELQERGWHVQPNHWVWPLNDVPFLRRNPELLVRPRHTLPRGIDWDLEAQCELITELSTYADELADAPPGAATRPGEFAWGNGAFGAADAYAYYGLLRKLKPRRVVEIGAGASTLLLHRALEANGGETDVTVIEPNPRWQVLGDLPAHWEFRHAIVQQAGLKVYDELEAGDVVFYDGSHCVDSGGDLNWMLFRVLPRLAPGVWIHFHDIFWPSDYPLDWILYEGLTWNEQYMLQAFLMHNGAYRARLVLGMLSIMRTEVMHGLFPDDRAHGVSAWIEKDPGWMKKVAADRRGDAT